MQPKKEGREERKWGYLVCFLYKYVSIAIETFFQTIIYIRNKSSSVIFRGGGVFYVSVSLSLHKHTFDIIVFDFVKYVEGGLGVLPQKNLGLNGVKLCNSRHQEHDIAL